MKFVKLWFSAAVFFSLSPFAMAYDYASLSAVSDNADTVWAKEADTITFTLTLDTAQDSDGTGQVEFSIGSATGLTANFAAVNTNEFTHMATYTVLAGQNGPIAVTGLTFQTSRADAIANVPAFPITPAPNVTVDTTAPVFASFSAISNNTDTTKATDGDSVQLAINLTTVDTWMSGNNLVYNIGTGAPTSPANYVATSGTNTKDTGFRAINITAADEGPFNVSALTFFDKAGNAITGFAAGAPSPNTTVDNMAPSVVSVTQTGNGRPFWPRFLKAGERVTYNITYSEAVTASVNAASTTTNATGALTDVSALNSTTDTIIATAMAGDNGDIVPTVNFDITDGVGNTATITSLGVITGGSATNIITADTTIPTLTAVSIASDNANSDWAKTGDTITVSITADEPITTPETNVTILGRSATLVPGCTFGACTSHSATLLLDGTESEGVAPLTIDFRDRAFNLGAQVTATTDGSSVTIDNTAPTAPSISIASNNVLDTTLAKTNDTITLSITVADNLSANIFTGLTPTILGQPAMFNLTTVPTGTAVELARMTDGSETSEVVVPYGFDITDSAGNVASFSTTLTTDGSSVQFDRTDPVLRNVRINATSADGSAFTGDAPRFYAKTGDAISLNVQICDYVDSTNNPPTGNIMGETVTFTDSGTVGPPGNCTTGAGNTSQWRRWDATLAAAPATFTEGRVTFAIDPKDNAGNVLIPSVTMTTNASRVIFDKTAPTPPTDTVDLGGAATAGYKPAPNAALYTWTNDTDPAGGTPRSRIHQYQLRYFNANTGIDEMVTQTRPPQSFAPTLMIPDLDPYELYMTARDKAGNDSPETLIYSQKYGVEISGMVTDVETGQPIAGAFVNVIAPNGSVCNNPNQEICSAQTDASGNYSLTVAPNTDYKIDVIKTPDYYTAKDDLKVTTTDVETNIALKHTENGDVQTGNQGTVITLDQAFDINGAPQTTYVNVFSASGEVTVLQTPEGITVTSFGTIVQIDSNNPDLLILDQGNNTYLIKTPAKILNVSDSTNAGSSVSSTFASGANRVGTRAPLGGASAGFQAGLSRADRVVNGFWTPQESREFARLLNQGSKYKVHQYVNRNGYTVFAGYQKGRMAMADMVGSDPNVRMRKQIVYRGQRRGSSSQLTEYEVAGRKELVRDIFHTDTEKSNEPKVLVVEEGNQGKAARMRVETKKTELTHDNPEIAGYGRKTKMYPSVYNKKANDARYVNKFVRTQAPMTVAPSRIKAKNTDMIVFRGKSRNGKKLALGQMFHNNPQLIAQRQRVVKR